MASYVGVVDSLQLEPLKQPAATQQQKAIGALTINTTTTTNITSSNNRLNDDRADDRTISPTSSANTTPTPSTPTTPTNNKIATARLTIIKPHTTPLAEPAENGSSLKMTPTSSYYLPAYPSTSRHYIKAAEAHGGHETTAFLQKEINHQLKMGRPSATLDKNAVSRNPSTVAKHEKKIGHRRVDEEGEVTYKKIQSKQIMGSIQLGIQHTVGSLASKPRRDLLMNDFYEMETVSFPPDGSSLTPAHHYTDFRFKVFAPIAFRYFRDLFGIAPDDFLMSMCAAPLRQLSNPGASGSIFYLTDDDEFIIKTVQKKECEFLQKLLPGYFMNLSQNPRTLLPKFFGLYCFHYNTKNVRLAAMNNLLPSDIKMHQKYDLKGSTFRRKASKSERQKESPTYKDLDFMEHHPNGIFLETDTYNALIKTIQRDCMVLESFQIMDYSLLVGVHNLDVAAKEKREERIQKARSRMQRTDDDVSESSDYVPSELDDNGASTSSAAAGSALNRSRSMNRQRLVAHSTAMESITADIDIPFDEDEEVPAGGIPARSEDDERLILYIGIIDILQSYRLEKKLEHTFKAIIYNGDTVSVCRPSFYAQRFQNFMSKTVFKKTPTFGARHTAAKRKTSMAQYRTPQRIPPNSIGPHIRPQIISGSSTPPPAFDEISEEDLTGNSVRYSAAPSYQNLMSQRSYLSSYRSTMGSDRTDEYSDDDGASGVSSVHIAKSPLQKQIQTLQLSKTSVQVTTIGCVGGDGQPHGQTTTYSSSSITQPDHKQSDEGIEQDVDGKKLMPATSTTIIQSTQEQKYTSTLVLSDVTS